MFDKGMSRQTSWEVALLTVAGALPLPQAAQAGVGPMAVQTHPVSLLIFKATHDN
jgi:hypothetical protein